MAIANPELMLNKMKCHTLEIIWKVSRAASQQLRRGFNVFAKSRLGNARWVPKEDLSSTYPSLDFRCLLIKSCIPTKWVVETLDRKKKCLFLLHLGQVVSFCSPLATSACLYLELSALESTVALAGGFGAASAPPHPPKKVKSPKVMHLQGFSAQGSVVVHFWNTILITILAAASFFFSA